MENINGGEGKREVISLGIGDPTAHSCFHTTDAAKEAVVESLLLDKFNGYSPTTGLPAARKAIANYLSRDLPYDLSPEDVYVTAGCTQAIETAVSILAKSNCNILLPRPGFPTYALCAAFRKVEVRYYDLVPDRNWQVNLKDIENLADQNTIAIVIINPGNPCGNVYSYEHLEERWLIPGWRLGWFVINDPNCTFKSHKIIELINKYGNICGGPATFIQAAVPKIIESTKEDFFMNTLKMLKKNSDICHERILEIPCINLPYKTQGSMFVMVKLNTTLLQDISDDVDFCYKLAKEESVILLPGSAPIQ
ncbi:hypothetical protein HAX54_039989 [Datura stramonium]|uniref:Aminotransferase class I/classII large domain-containing protein n=1 Tax=Datura stramonium TaxID=4076 RepID=A0ABS8RNT2_DATST|nr:hypothetical protein [Datura stramonium]